MKRTLVALALCLAGSCAFAQNTTSRYAQDADQSYSEDEEQTYAPVQDQTYSDDEDQTYAPVEDQTYADDEDATLPPVVVQGTDTDRIVVECEPPNAAAACANFHELIRANFTPQEIGLLFGGSTAYLAYPTAYDFTRQRYMAFLRNLQDNGMQISVSNQ
jgi:hypothetical protein